MAMATAILIARLLGQTEFGKWGMVRSTVFMVGIFAGSGLGVIATKYVAEFWRTDPKLSGQLIGFLITNSLIYGGAILYVFSKNETNLPLN